MMATLAIFRLLLARGGGRQDRWGIVKLERASAGEFIAFEGTKGALLTTSM